MVLRNSFDEMYDWQMEERKIFNYPPFCRIIKITVKSRDRNKLEEFSSLAGKYLREYFGSRVLGPEYPVISRIQQWYIKNIIIKIEKNKPFPKAREAVAGTIEKLESLPGASSVRFSIDVDPYS
jgi:primosomal protein N' (replication factor Y)